MADTRFADLQVTISGHVATVEIQRPPANYFDLALIDALASAYEYLDGEPDCRAIVLGSDGRHFCAGADFGTPTGDAERDADPVGTDALYARSLTLFSLSKPVVAARGSRSAPTSGSASRPRGSRSTSPGSASTRVSASRPRCPGSSASRRR